MRTPARVGHRLDVTTDALTPGERPVLSLLRPGKRPSGEEVEQILRHVIGRIRRNWPAVEIMVRGDSHFATPEVMELLEEKRCGYIFALSTNMRLTEIGRPWSEDVATRRALSKTQKMRRFFQRVLW